MAATIRTVIFCLLAGLAGCSSSSTQQLQITPGLQVAYVVEGKLYLWQAGTVEELVRENVIQPYISPAGSTIVYTTGENVAMPETLWLFEDKKTHRLAAHAYLYQVSWVNSRMVYYNTFDSGTLGPTARNDLYQVALPSGDVEMITPGGSFSVSPSGDVVVVEPGLYGIEPGRISRVSRNAATEIMPFEAVSTGSHISFYPEIQWHANNGFYVALPDADILYNELSGTGDAVVIWSVDLANNTAVKIEEVPASLYGLPQVGDENHIAYLRRGGNQFQLYLNDTEYTAGNAGTLLAPRWLPDGERFIYGQDNAYWIGQAGQAPRRWLDANPMTEPHILADGIVYTTVNDQGQFEIRYAAYDAATFIQIAQTGQTLPAYDAVIVR